MDTVYNIQHGLTLQWALYTTSSMGSHYNGHCKQHPAWVYTTMGTVYNIQHGFTLQWTLYTTSSMGSHYNGTLYTLYTTSSITMNAGCMQHPAWVHITMGTVYNIQHGFTLHWTLYTTSSMDLAMDTHVWATSSMG